MVLKQLPLDESGLGAQGDRCGSVKYNLKKSVNKKILPTEVLAHSDNFHVQGVQFQ